MKKSLFLVLFYLLLLNSCSGSESDEGRDVVTYVKLSANTNSVLLGNSVKFSLSDNLNNDVTSQAQFFINGQALAGNTYHPDQLGSYTVSAIYKGFKSKDNVINVVALTGVNFVHRILYEDFTGTWCGNCPIASIRFEELLKKNNKAVFLGIHGPYPQSDPFTNEASMAIIKDMNIKAYPTILINHSRLWSTANNDYLDMSFPLQSIEVSSKIGIAIKSKLEGSQLTGEYNLSFADNFQGLSVMAYIVEDKITYPQHNYFNGYGGKPILYNGIPVIEDYQNHNVLRALLTSVKGDVLPVANTQNNTIFQKSFSFTIPSNFVKSNVKIIIAVTNNKGETLNVREVNIDTINELETL